MKIYVAGKFEEKDIILNTHKKLKEMGHTISYNWTTHKNIKPYIKNQKIALQYAQNELDGILNSDIFIYLTNKTGHTLFMEFGTALASLKITGKPQIYAVGAHNVDSTWFFNPLVKRIDSLEEVIEAIKVI
jgi:hypothetical protein